MITFEPKEKQTAVDENILIDGVAVGTMRPYMPLYAEKVEDRFQATFVLPGSNSTSGFGPTREEAISEALDTGIKNAEEAIKKLRGIQERLTRSDGDQGGKL